MKKVSLAILALLVTLVFFTTIAYSADSQLPASASPETSNASAAVTAVKSASFEGIMDTSFVNVVLNLLDTDVEYRLDDSSAIVLACSPFDTAEIDDHNYQMASKISVGLKFSF